MKFLKSLKAPSLILGCALAWANHAQAETFNITTPRGMEAAKTFSSPNSVTEICVLPKPFPNQELSDKRLEQARELCSLDFYGAKYVACPKLWSTNPGVEIEEIPEGISREEYFAKQCPKEQDRDGKKLAKFKQSISCSYSPSILTYPMLNIALGDSLEMPPVVIRTMDAAEHKKLTQFALKYAKDTMAATWGYFKSAEADPKNYSKKDRIYTGDFSQIYGALVKNPSHEIKYSEINKGLNGFLASEGFSDVKSSASVDKIVGTDFTKAAPRLTRMKDISMMLLMDYIMGQQDRFGNIHALEYIYSFDGKKVAKRKVKKDDKPAAGEVLVKEMLLKDNDCGMRSGEDNKVKNLGLLQKVRHMAPKNYRKLMELAAFSATGALSDYLQTELLMTKDDVKQFTGNLKEAASILNGLCKQGSLKLDLDLEAVLSGAMDAKNAACDI